MKLADMKIHKLGRGYHLNEFKEYTNKKPVETLPLPDEVVIPLLQHLGEACDPVVNVGDKVKPGQLIGSLEEYWMAPVHSSVAGKVTAIEPRMTDSGQEVNSVVIEVDKENSEFKLPARPHDPHEMDVEELKDAIRHGGGVGMGGGACPTYININLDEPVETLILNGAECEPFLTCDQRQMVEWADELIGGAEILMRVIGAKKTYIGIETNKEDAIELLATKVENRHDIEVVALEAKYPQGYKKNIIKSVTGRTPPEGARSSEVGCIVKNVGTAITTYNAVVYGKGCFERVVTVSGPGTVPKPGNYLVKVGTPIGHILTHCGVDLDSLDGHKVIMGGPMTGAAQKSFDVPIIKKTTGVLVLPPEFVESGEISPCIRCGKCSEHCPIYLNPGALSVFVEAGDFESAANWRLDQCAECGICSYVCPSRRPVTQMILRAKPEVKKIVRARRKAQKEREAAAKQKAAS